MNQPVKRKRIPYGMMNFIDVREDDCYYVDKTHYIPLIENANKYFFYIFRRNGIFGIFANTASVFKQFFQIFHKVNVECFCTKILYCGKSPIKRCKFAHLENVNIRKSCFLRYISEKKDSFENEIHENKAIYILYISFENKILFI